MSTTRFDIVNGPSRETLIDAFKYAFDKTTKVKLKFSVALGYTPDHSLYFPMNIGEIKILGIEHEDGSGESFNIKGTCVANTAEHEPAKPRKFEACYSAKTRKGSIWFIS